MHFQFFTENARHDLVQLFPSFSVIATFPSRQIAVDLEDPTNLLFTGTEIAETRDREFNLFILNCDVFLVELSFQVVKVLRIFEHHPDRRTASQVMV